jgi:hypothetical protein
MNWKKSIFVVTLAGLMVISMAGCGKADELSTPTTQTLPSPSTSDNGTVITPPDGTRLTPPEGKEPGERPLAPEMDLAAAAAKLGISEEQLSEALGDLTQGMPDFAASAAQLGISEDSLREALGLPEGVPLTDGHSQGNPPPAASDMTDKGQ